jgi:spectinomycin phosphotransferase
VHQPPADVVDRDVLAAVRAAWSPDASTCAHLPVGFGAHHWRAGALFVTLDALGSRHTAHSLEAAYAGAARLGLGFVVASLPAESGRFTVPFAGGALSATPWVDGAAPADSSPAVALVEQLHRVVPPAGLPRWQPLVPASLATDIDAAASRPWTKGPHGEEARGLLLRARDRVAAWCARYHALAAAARSRRWVATHGEPHERNVMLTVDGPKLVDWESLKLAPPERDLRVLGLPGKRDMMELFDLEWRLDEVAQYSEWFSSAHGDTDDDRTALAGLRYELERGP